MASGFYNNYLYDGPRGNIQLTVDTLKLAMVGTGYTYDPDHVFADEAGTADVTGQEIVVTGYTGGFGGGGRKTTTITGQANNTNNRGDFAIADLTWTALATGATIAWAILLKEITNDAASKLVCAFDVTDTPTNGGDITLDFATLAAGGNMRFAA